MILLASTFWIKTFELLLALSILVVFHEFGHYFFARVFGVWVENPVIGMASICAMS